MAQYLYRCLLIVTFHIPNNPDNLLSRGLHNLVSTDGFPLQVRVKGKGICSHMCHYMN